MSKSIQALIVFALAILLGYIGNRYGGLIDECSSIAFVLNFAVIDYANSHFFGSIATNFFAFSISPFAFVLMALGFVAPWLLFMNASLKNRSDSHGSARWGTKAEGRAFLNQDSPELNLIFSQNYGLAVKR